MSDIGKAKIIIQIGIQKETFEVSYIEALRLKRVLGKITDEDIAWAGTVIQERESDSMS